MKFTQDQKVRFFANILKGAAAIGGIGVIAFLAYNFVTAEQRGR